MTGRKLSKEEKEVLISEVKTRAFLWNDREKNFKNLSMTKRAWEEIGEILNVSGDVAKTKWKNLKDKFRKELQKITKLRSGSEASTVTSPWAFFEAMMFAKDVVLPGRTVGSLPLQESPSTSSSPYLAESEEVICSDDDVGLPLQTYVCSNASTLKPRARKRKLDAFDEKMLELEEKKLDIVSREQRQSVDFSDPDYNFLMSLLPHIKSLSAVEKLTLYSTLLREVLNAVKMHESNEKE
ncbi:uncharacterized protein [Periplaneta americana]|uniref:uncharacterized protein n=1 Tax=Periplaneta americana TaxID=6978 RepID=UPI0037E8F142